MIEVSVIIVGYYGDDWLKECLKSLVISSRDKLHLILANNFGNSNLKSLNLESYESEILELHGPIGFAHSNNLSLVSCSVLKDYIVFLNQDTISQPLWIDPCLSALKNDHTIGAISPLIRNYDDTGWDPSFLDCLDKHDKLALDQSNLLPELIYSEHAPAPALIVRKSVLGLVGPFDPLYGSYYEDYDLCARIRKAGYRIGFSTKARIQHFSGSATNNDDRRKKRMRQIIRNRGIYKIRHQPGSRFSKALSLFCTDFPLRLLRSLLHTPSSQPPLTVLSAYKDLFGEMSRLLSESKDKQLFMDYLQSIGWSNSQHF